MMATPNTSLDASGGCVFFKFFPASTLTVAPPPRQLGRSAFRDFTQSPQKQK
jgi:hypothetical protein